MAVARGEAAAPASTDGAPRAEASKLGQVSWALFDWANQPFFTIITTFIFSSYFANVLVYQHELAALKTAYPDRSAAELSQLAQAAGQSAWAFTQSASGLFIALLSPFLGSMADAAGRRKPFILVFQLLLAVGCIALWWARPEHADWIGLISLAVILATIGAEISIVFNNAFLPNIVRPERMGWLSGFGWGMGYLGGLVSLFIVLAVSRPSLLGLAPPGSPPLFGLDRAAYEVERLIGPASALWLFIFVLPMFLFTPDGKRSGLGVADAAGQGFRTLIGTLRKLRHYRNPLLYLVAYMIYNDGLAAVIAFGGVYASATFLWPTETLGVFGIVLTVLGVFGAFAGGWLDDRIGSKRTVQFAIAGTIIATLGILSVSRTGVLFVVGVPEPAADRGLFGSLQEQVFMGFALLIGICMGPMQAASRTLVGRLAPAGMSGEFYGLFALSGRATTFMAPALIGVVTWLTNSNRFGMMVVLAFLVVGFILLWQVREEQAQRIH
ncbi:MFS transporter [Reyranella sp. CPCC 100927]|uniref:MFS transporter n=1 Tax=Reyranella sp. CPCC 100927 TaxID=2599616 RepID=UPI0011B3BCA5|nr:MFS transporter [Reyranella sp. CPCC 100927]TWT14864.1 MFS transporter [Reyranella sp. CPCC 100927]